MKKLNKWYCRKADIKKMCKKKIWWIMFFGLALCMPMKAEAEDGGLIGTVTITDKIVCTDGSGEEYELCDYLKRDSDFEDYIFPGTSYRFEDHDELGVASTTPVVSGIYDGSGSLQVTFIYMVDRNTFDRILEEDISDMHYNGSASNLPFYFPSYYDAIVLDTNGEPMEGIRFRRVDPWSLMYNNTTDWDDGKTTSDGFMVIGSLYGGNDDFVDTCLFRFLGENGYVPFGDEKDMYGNYVDTIYTSISTSEIGNTPLEIYDANDELIAIIRAKRYDSEPILQYGRPVLDNNNFIITYAKDNYDITITTDKGKANHITSIDEITTYESNKNRAVYVTIQKTADSSENKYFQYEDFTYEILDGYSDKVKITGYTGMDENVKIPQYIEDKEVVSIGEGAFYGSFLKKIELPVSVTDIGDSAFEWCRALEGIELPENVTNIADDAFYGCESLTNVKLQNNVISIGKFAFACCKALETIEIPGSVTSIGNSAFSDCWSLTNVELQNGVTSIGESAFKNCNSLKTIEIPDSVTSIGEDAFSGCDSLTSITIPNSVTRIGDDAFSGCDSLTSITIPNSVTRIGDDAFSGCDSLTSITIPNSVTQIGNHAFYRCDSLTSITIPNSVTQIGDYAFYGCDSLTSITIPNSITRIGNSAFNCCSDSFVLIVEANSYALQYARHNGIYYQIIGNTLPDTPMPSGTKPDTTPDISAGDTKPDTTTDTSSTGSTAPTTPPAENPTPAPDTTAGNGEAALLPNTTSPAESVTSLTVNKADYKVTSTNPSKPTVTYLKFSSRTAKTVTVPATITADGITYKVTAVAANAFKGNTKLTKVTVGKNVTSIGKNAFHDCKKLKTITIKSAKLKTVGKNAIKGINAKAVIKVPKKQLSSYRKLFTSKTGYKKSMKVTK